MQEFDGKVAVVTGAASGMGRAFAERFAEEGMKVVLADVEEPALTTAVQQLRQREFDVIGVTTDVSKQEALDTLLARTVEAYGKAHILCNNAGVSGEYRTVWEATQKDWDWIMGVNFWGVVNGIRAFVPHMLAHGEESHVVNTASVAGLGVGWGMYGVTKHAVVALTEWLSANLRVLDAKIGVSVLCPVGVATNIGNAARNRPAELMNDASTPEGVLDGVLKRYREVMNVAVAAGKQPAEIADIVFNAIRNDHFYILTHPEEEEERVRWRAELIVSRQRPPLGRYLLEAAERARRG